MIGIALSFGLWQLPQLEMLTHNNAFPSSVMSGIIIIGSIAWMLSIVLLIVVQKRLSLANVNTQAVLEDELVIANRLEATKYGYILLFGMSALLFALSHFADIAGIDVARLLVVVGVCVPLLVFSWLER